MKTETVNSLFERLNRYFVDRLVKREYKLLTFPSSTTAEVEVCGYKFMIWITEPEFVRIDRIWGVSQMNLKFSPQEKNKVYDNLKSDYKKHYAEAEIETKRQELKRLTEELAEYEKQTPTREAGA